MCANTMVTPKIPCALISKPKTLACIKDRQWLVPYFSQVKAWMDVETCWKWFNKVFLPEVKKQTGCWVILLLDNALGHFETFERWRIPNSLRDSNVNPKLKTTKEQGVEAFQWYKKRFKARSFYPCNRALKIRKSIRDSNSQHGSSLWSVRVHSLTFFALSRACEVTPGSPSWPATLPHLALVTSPRLGLR